ncbi:response regulator transcription factor [Phenylobacterium sp.]|jgi:DNA-binding response OmpR family regulator|uniref:response regulator transcription factor n=1 Tax=Phenylobacterium sp. TaxID=1871053 RepID=UPI0035ADB011
MRIAALDDDDAQREAISRLLVGGGHSCQCFHLGAPLIASLRRETFDLLILDWNLPDMSGLEVLTWAQKNLSPCPPVLLLTSRASEADIVTGLNSGADDYVVKPVQGGVLLARVNALLRRSYPDRGAGGVETYGDYQFNLPAEQATVRGELAPLTAKEFGLALLLFRNIHRALSRGHILEAIWGRNPDLPTRTLDMHISRIRTKLDLRPQNGFRLAPVYSYGYRLERLTDGWVETEEAVS